MKIVIFGLTVSSSWGNGHATLWRGLCRALGELGHDVVFYERDVPYYAAHRDGVEFTGCDLRLYGSWEEVAESARGAVKDADAAVVTSYCPDAVAATDIVLGQCPGRHVFYDLDTPITLQGLEKGNRVPYVPRQGLGDFDLVLSFTGGRALRDLETRLGARRTAALYGWVDPAVHRLAPPDPRFVADVSYLGTYSNDRRQGIVDLFVVPAEKRPERRFLLAGALYPNDFPWRQNVLYRPHVAPGEHAAFYGSCRVSLNVTRGAMVRWGWCPSGRLFEAAACGVPQVTDDWEGLPAFFEPGTEILVAKRSEDVIKAIERSDEDLAAMARRARARALAEHTAVARARTLLDLLRGA